MATFRLPDLGEGLAEAEIVAWHVKPGDVVRADQPMVSVETAKAVVEIPVPCDGTVSALHGRVGDIIATGAPLVDFDAGTVVGSMPAMRENVRLDAPVVHAARRATAAPRRPVLPLARGVARHLGIDLAGLAGSGPEGAIRLEDVLEARRGARPAQALDPLPPGARVEPLKGARRAMAHSMSLSEAPTSTVCDDADVEAWTRRGDYMTRLLHALKVACRAEPALNAWYDPARTARVLFEHLHVAIAVDAPDGLFVPVVRHVERKTAEELRADVARQKQAAVERSVTPEDLKGYTMMLSNFGTLAGRYGTPRLVSPAVAILGVGRVRAEAVVVDGALAVHRRMPLSLSFDHRCVTGGEACRFLAAVIDDLERPD